MKILADLKEIVYFPSGCRSYNYCRREFVNVPEYIEDNLFEIRIRLEFNSELCCDTINGTQYCETFSNVAFKYPRSYNKK